MRKFIVLLLCFQLISSPCAASVCTSTAVGDGTIAGATWDCGHAPTNTDSAVLAHSLTLTDARTIGTSDVSGTAAVTVNSGKTFTVNAPFSSAGELWMEKGAILAGNYNGSTTNGSITFVTPANQIYAWKTLGTGSGQAQINFTGTDTNHFVVSSSGPGSNAWLNFGAGHNPSFNLSNVIFNHIGDATHDAISASNINNTNNYFRNLLFNNCGRPYFQWAGGTTYDTIFDRIDLRNTLSSSEIIRIVNNYTFTSGTRQFTNITASTSGAYRTSYISFNGALVDNIVTYNTAIWPSCGSGGTIKNRFSVYDISASNPNPILGANNATIQDNIFYARYSNPHHISEFTNASPVGPNTYRNNVFDGDGYWSSDSGDLVIPAHEMYFSNNISINKAGTLGTHLNTTGLNGHYLNNTMDHSMGLTIGETTGNAAQVAEYKSNLIVNPYLGSGTTAGNGIHQDTAFVRQTGLALDYNCYYGPMGTPNIAYMRHAKSVTGGTLIVGTANTTTKVIASGANFTGAQAGDYWWNNNRSALARISNVDSSTQVTLETAIPSQASNDNGYIYYNFWSDPTYKYGQDGRGLHDINTNPRFIDDTRSLSTWDLANGGPGTIANIASEIVKLNGFDSTGSPAVYNPSYSIGSALAYIRRGYTPLLGVRHLAHDGGDIGAVPVWRRPPMVVQ